MIRFVFSAIRYRTTRYLAADLGEPTSAACLVEHAGRWFVVSHNGDESAARVRVEST